jgi:hypothetical protein
MKRESFNFRNIDDQSGAGARGCAGVASNAKPADAKPATRNWAWAHTSDSYDWMDSHSPLPSAELLD